MNKQDWTYKKLGEVCDIICGQDYKKVESSNGKYPIYGTGGIMGFANQFRCPAYSVIIGRKGSINNPLYVEEDFWNVDTAFGIVPSKANLISKYFFYFCKSYDFSKHNVAVTIPSLRRIDLLKIPIPVPPLAEQERIVAELDLLSGIIEKKKEQLKAYDQLAQSVFYTMFGDPIDNPKGWEVKKLKDLCDKITDGTHNSPINTEIGDYKYITAKNIKKDGITLNNITYVSADIHKAIYERCNPEYGDVLYIKDGITTGIATINTLNEEFSLLSSVALLKPKGCLMNYYLKAVLNMPSQYANIRESMGGAAITRLTIAKINEIRIPVPPLSLQQEFAKTIEAIERQKALVQQSIDETQTMFDCTMDKYFG